MTVVYIGIGSNSGNRSGVCESAIGLLGEAGSVVACSGWYETAPWGDANQESFLNAVVALDTNYEAHALLKFMQDIENRLGRKRSTRRWGPRTIDLDIILFGDSVISTDTLKVPHPLFRERAFVLAPLCEMAPDIIDPVTGKTVRELYETCNDAGDISKLDNLSAESSPIVSQGREVINV